MRRKLGPVVGRDSSRPESRGLDQSYYGACQRLRLLSLVQLVHERVAALPVHKGYHGSLSLPAHDSVHLPVADGTGIAIPGSFIYGDPVPRGQSASCVPRAPRPMPSMAQVPADVILTVRGACGYSVIGYSVIDVRLRHGHAISPQPSRHLLRRPLLCAYEHEHDAAHMRVEGTVAGQTGPATPGPQHRQVPAVHALGVGIAPYLARDGAHAYPDSLSNKTKGHFLWGQHAYCVSLLRG